MPANLQCGEDCDGDYLPANVPYPRCFERLSQTACGSGIYVSYTLDTTAEDAHASYTYDLTLAEWIIESSGEDDDGFFLTATDGSQFLKLVADGPPDGPSLIDLCVWPSEPADDQCNEDCSG